MMESDRSKLKDLLNKSADCYNNAIKELSQAQIELVDKAIDSAVEYDQEYNTLSEIKVQPEKQVENKIMESDFTNEERKEFDTYADAYNKFVKGMNIKRIHILNELLSLHQRL